MAFTESETQKIHKAMNAFFELCRPSEKIRNDYDYGYKIERQSVVLFEIRNSLQKKKEKVFPTIGKATYVRTENQWRVYWERADFKWHSYTPAPKVKQFNQFLKLIMEDKHHCFFG